MKTAIVFLVLVAALVFADSEQQIDNCNKDEIEMKTWKASCITARSNYRAALAEKQKYDGLYFQAAKDYDFAVGEFVEADKIEHLRLSEKVAATTVYNLARKTEDSLCNHLVRNVKPGTPCARLLNRARKNNRLVQCRAAKVSLANAEKVLEERTRVHKIAFDIRESKLVAKIAKQKIRDEANTVRLQKEGIYQIRLSTKTTVCGKFRALRTTFYGRAKKFDAVHGNYGYRVFKFKTNWNNAEQYCYKRGGHLLSIHDDFENTLSRKLCGSGDNVPIGFYRYQNGQFSWSDGTANEYTRWAPGEPNNAGGEPYGEEYTSGGRQDQWNDVGNREWNCFVCKFARRK